MAAPNSTIAPLGANTLYIGSAPSATNVFLEGWCKPSLGTNKLSIPVSIYGGTDWILLFILSDAGSTTTVTGGCNIADNSGAWFFNANSVAPPYFGPDGFSDTVTSAQSNDWIGWALEVVRNTSASTFTVRMWRRYGAAGSLIGPTTFTYAWNTVKSGWACAAISKIGLEDAEGNGISDAFAEWKVRAYDSSAGTPDNATIQARLSSMLADTTAWADWSLAYSGSPDYTDSSGHSRTLSHSGTFSQGAAAPIANSAAIVANAAGATAAATLGEQTPLEIVANAAGATATASLGQATPLSVSASTAAVVAAVSASTDSSGSATTIAAQAAAATAAVTMDQQIPAVVSASTGSATASASLNQSTPLQIAGTAGAATAAASATQTTPATIAATAGAVTASATLGQQSTITIAAYAGGLAIGPHYPIKLGASGTRYTVDQDGKPFLWYGESAGSMLTELSREDAALCLRAFASNGVQMAAMTLIGKIGTTAPTNYYGDAPFTGANFTTPNEAYFANVDYIVSVAASLGIQLFLFPLFLGYPGAGQGWYDEVAAASNANMTTWGTYVGNRYKNCPNIVWAIGGDHDPTGVASKLSAFVTALLAADPNHLITCHNTGEADSFAYSSVEPWFTLANGGVNGVYSSSATVYTLFEAAYGRSPTMPFYMLEYTFENDLYSTPPTEQQLRAVAYWSILFGGMGWDFGVNPVWHFDSLGLGPGNTTWQQNLNTTGAQCMQRARNLFRSRPWHLLVPDSSHTTLTAGYGTHGNANYVQGARASDGSTFIAYLPVGASLTIDLTKISGSNADAWWFDPATGGTTHIGTYATSGSHTFTTSGGSDGDMVLVVDDASKGFVVPGADPSGQAIPITIAAVAAAAQASVTAGQSTPATVAASAAAAQAAANIGQTSVLTVAAAAGASTATVTADQSTPLSASATTAASTASMAASQSTDATVTASSGGPVASATMGQTTVASAVASTAAAIATVTAGQLIPMVVTAQAAAVQAVAFASPIGDVQQCLIEAFAAGATADIVAGQESALAVAANLGAVIATATASQEITAVVAGQCAAPIASVIATPTGVVETHPVILTATLALDGNLSATMALDGNLVATLELE